MVTKPTVARSSLPTPANVPRNQVAPEATRSHQHRFAGRHRNTAAPAPTNTNPASRSSRARFHDRPRARRPSSAYTPKPTAAAQVTAAARVPPLVDRMTRGTAIGRSRGAASPARAVMRSSVGAGPCAAKRAVPPRFVGLALQTPDAGVPSVDAHRQLEGGVMRIGIRDARHGTALRPHGLALLGVAAAALTACSSGGGVDGAGVDAPQAGPAADTTAASESASAPVSAFEDSFDDDRHGWALPPSPSGTTTVEGGDFVWDSKQPGQRPHVLATTLGEAFDEGRLEMTDVLVTASVTAERGAAAMGVSCREVPDSDADFQWYEFVVRDGYAAIRLADSGGNLDVLAETSSPRLPLGSTTSIAATCVDESDDSATLSLSLDGTAVLDTRVEDPLGNGPAGLVAYDAAEDESADLFLISWHDFTVEPS